MLKHCLRALLGLTAVLFLTAGTAAAQTKLLRFPDIFKDKVVFTYAGDLWLTSSSGGAATRLTAHPGLELFAKFSPDGRWIAFTGQYDGDEQVYVIPATGGVPKQLTFYPARGPLPPRWGYDNQVMGWTRDGKSVLFRSMRDGWDLGGTRLYTVPVDGGLGEALPMPLSGAGDFSPDGKQIVYTPFARDFRTWKRYQGGWAQDLWIFDLATHDAKNITNTQRSERDPMWVGGKIFFASDRNGTLNLYSYAIAGGQTAQLTQSTQWDVRWPSADEDGQIVYEMGGELNVLDTRTGQARHLSISVPTDGLYDRPSQISVADDIETAALSPKGERALFVARGDLFTVPAEKGVTRNLTRTPGAHDKAARWSPDGRKIAFISDRSGEEEIWLVNQDGSGKPEQLTTGGKAMRYTPAWSPDSKRLAFSDKDGRVWVLTVADRKLLEVAHETRGTTRDYVWSPGSNLLAFSLTDPSGLRSIWIWSADDSKLHRVTGEMFHESNPAWSPDGDYLYFLSAREFAPILDGLDFNYALDRNIGIYALALRKDVANLFPPQSDEVAVAEEKSEKKEEKKEEKKGAPPTRIDYDGLAARVIHVPVPFDNYSDLSAAAGKLLYTQAAAPFLGRESVAQPSLRIFSLADRKDALLAEAIDGYELSGDGSKVLVHHTEGGPWEMLDATLQGKDSKKPISTAGLVLERVPAQEWPEIFEEAWRRYRDFFYTENMNGYDWAALHDQYKQLLAYVGHRSDLNYVIGEMIAELNNSHAYVAGGDWQSPSRPRVALPGARFALDKAAGRYRIAEIFQGQNEEDRYRSPLTEVGVDAHVGDYVLAIDGVDLPADDNPYRLLRGKAGQPVQLTLNAKPSVEGARQVTFRPLSTETDLIYLKWVDSRRAMVDKLSGGRIGYLHLPDMGEDGLREFIKYFYAQIRKEGLILDDRNNGGGFVSPMLLDRLRRSLLGMDYGRLSDDPFPYPQAAMYNHMACLINEGSGSDGDIFPAMFRQAGLGPVIGKRTWGGVVGISGHGPMIDGGQIFVPEAGSVSLQGEWIIEGHGVDPDIEIENDPKSVLAGRDPQLERGVEEVMKKIQSEPRVFPKKPAGPNRTQVGIEAAGQKK
jgi:tricorn protease